jgi:hypothetical protein
MLPMPPEPFDAALATPLGGVLPPSSPLPYPAPDPNAGEGMPGFIGPPRPPRPHVLHPGPGSGGKSHLEYWPEDVMREFRRAWRIVPVEDDVDYPPAVINQGTPPRRMIGRAWPCLAEHRSAWALNSPPPAKRRG